MTYNECPSSAIIVTLRSLLTFIKCEVVISSLLLVKKYQEVSYLHAKKIPAQYPHCCQNSTISNRCDQSYYMKRFPPGLYYKLSDHADQIESMETCCI